MAGISEGFKLNIETLEAQERFMSLRNMVLLAPIILRAGRKGSMFRCESEGCEASFLTHPSLNYALTPEPHPKDQGVQDLCMASRESSCL